jgi:hypothetical protein
MAMILRFSLTTGYLPTGWATVSLLTTILLRELGSIEWFVFSSEGKKFWVHAHYFASVSDVDMSGVGAAMLLLLLNHLEGIVTAQTSYLGLLFHESFWRVIANHWPVMWLCGNGSIYFFMVYSATMSVARLGWQMQEVLKRIWKEASVT